MHRKPSRFAWLTARMRTRGDALYLLGLVAAVGLTYGITLAVVS